MIRYWNYTGIYVIISPVVELLNVKQQSYLILSFSVLLNSYANFYIKTTTQLCWKSLL